MVTPTSFNNNHQCLIYGLALPVVLVFLALMTLIGITAIRNITLGERIAGNAYNYQVAFQSAERALRECERLLLKNDADQALNILDSRLEDRGWEKTWSPQNSYHLAKDTNSPAKEPPRCMIERIRLPLTNEDFYLITAKATGLNSTTRVMLQSQLKFSK